MAGVDAVASEDEEVEGMVVAIVMDAVAKEEVVEGAMVITHMNSPAGGENVWQKLVYTLHTNGNSSPHNKRIIFKK